MMTISKPNKPYILFESIGNKHENRDERWLHLVSSEENSSIRIGRGHDCEIRITDISVSRKHAEIVLKDGDFYIADTKAKFGTLIRLEEDFTLVPNKPIRIQFARTVFEFKVKSEQMEEVETE
jgi:pSer/pThr/pTyr-binding forkhead associated (FHA) protein